jgi:N-acetylneuraminic acid mutarotase
MRADRRTLSVLRTALVLSVVSTLMLAVAGRADAAGAWQKVASMPQWRWDTQAATGSDGKIYVIGGCDTGQCGPPDCSDAVFVYDPATDSWSELPAGLPGGRCQAATAGDDDGHIYVLGGLGNPGVSTDPLVYTIATGSWATLPPMPEFEPFYMGAAVGPDGRLYAAGGFRGSRIVQVYDPSTNTWSETAHLPIRVQGPDVVTVGSRLYVVGGYYAPHQSDNGLRRSAFAYDPSTNTWQRLHRMLRAQGFNQAAVGADGRIYLVGGYLADGDCCFVPTRKVIAYDPATDTWSQAPSLPKPISGQAVARDAAGNIYSTSGYGNTDVWKLTIDS